MDAKLLIGPNVIVVNKIKIELTKEFDIKDLGHTRRILGTEITGIDLVLA